MLDLHIQDNKPDLEIKIARISTNRICREKAQAIDSKEITIIILVCIVPVAGFTIVNVNGAEKLVAFAFLKVHCR